MKRKELFYKKEYVVIRMDGGYPHYRKFDTISTIDYGNGIIVKDYSRTLFGFLARLFKIRYRLLDHYKIMVMVYYESYK
jgi:hypothetical protein